MYADKGSDQSSSFFYCVKLDVYWKFLRKCDKSADPCMLQNIFCVSTMIHKLNIDLKAILEAKTLNITMCKLQLVTVENNS